MTVAQETTETAETPLIDWIKIALDKFDELFGISKFNQAVPLMISGIAIGVTLVNRNFTKCLPHIGGATVASLISAVFITVMNGQKGTACNQFTTAFLWYTIGYISICMGESKKLDTNSLIGIILSFIALVFVDVMTFLGGVCKDLGLKTYIGMMLLGMVGGIGGYYATYYLNKPLLYDFAGCSCDDCAGKCAKGGKVQTIMAKRMTSAS
jgi:hypothetical protein